jgi:plasmid stabilization system protein ParE
VYSERSKEDLLNIVYYLNTLNPTTGTKYFRLIKSRIDKLREMPTANSLVRSERLRKLGYRWAFVKNYVVFFTVDEELEEVFIRRILYSRMNFDELV